MKKYKSSVTYSNSQVGNQLTNERTCVIYIYNSLIYLNFRVSFVMEIKLEMDIKDIVCVSNMNRKWDEEYSSIDCCLEYTLILYDICVLRCFLQIKAWSLAKDDDEEERGRSLECDKYNVRWLNVRKKIFNQYIDMCLNVSKYTQ